MYATVMGHNSSTKASALEAFGAGSRAQLCANVKYPRLSQPQILSDYKAAQVHAFWQQQTPRTLHT